MHRSPPIRPPFHRGGGFLVPFLTGIALTAPLWLGSFQSQPIPAPFPYYYPLPIPYQPLPWMSFPTLPPSAPYFPY
ncbi:MAG TPA: hypothetical protein VIK63_01860 [Haloplasmataceae bacterium]